MRTIEKRNRQRGIALVLVIFALLLLSAIGLAMLFSSDTETGISVNYRDKQGAIYGALAGLQEARDRIHPLTGDLGPGTNLSSGGLNIVPTALPSTSAANVLYLINPAPGETVAPWNPTNKYFDTELCQESYFVNVLGVTAGTPGTPCPATSASVPAGSAWYAWYDNSKMQTNTGATGTGGAATMEAAYQLTSGSTKIPLTYKWVRITLKADNMTPINVGTGNGTQVCWDGSHEQQLQAGYHTDCTPPSGGITNIAVTASGAGYTSVPNVTISGGGGSGATATAVVGQLPVGITSVTLTNGGAGYTNVPAVTITPSDGNGSGAIVNATLNNTLPVSSVSWTSSTPACYAIGSAPTVSFSPAGATASVAMTGHSCIYGFTASGSCSSKNVTANVTASNGTGSGFAGTVTAGSNKKADGTYVPSNPGNYATVPTTFSVASPCSAVTIAPTYGIQINTVNVTAGGSYPAGNPPSVAFGGATPVGGSPTGTATLSGTVNPGPVTGLSIPFGGNGSGYDATPTLTIAAPSCTPGPSCVQATGTASIATDYGVLSINITNAGTGYSQANPPTVTISGGGGSGATATASVGSAGASMGRVYLLTALAVTPSGSRAMVQMETGVTYGSSYTFGIGGALTLIGPEPSFGTPHSQNFQMIGTDCPTCAPAPSGCNTTAVPSRDAIGVYDPTNATNPSAVQTVIGDLAKPNNYIGANSTPDVANANLGNPTAANLNAFVGQAAAAATNVYGTPTASVNNPTINLGTAANPAIDVVYGNYSMGPTTGYGILVVTGTLTFSGNYSWNGLILVIGAGASIMNGGGNGQIVGAVYVANTSGNSFGSPSASWNGGGGNGIQYDHCWADYMLSKIPPLPPAISASALKVISLRTEVY
jgi:Tfp pilus assembly protein PilX